ncbi:MAG: flavin reductase [Peptococcaceae bacterium]|nr:flavin reductase [Peptococcaceae bacterium]
MDNIKELNTDIFKLFDNQWALLTAGPMDDYNTMTISWGGLGTLWNPAKNGRQVATVYVRPSRHTFSYMEANDTFTISFFDESHRKDLSYLGSHSGRDEDKVAKTSLTPKACAENTVGFAEARLTLVCKKLYSDAMDLDKIPEDVCEKFYNDGTEPHHFYIGEIVAFEEK